MQTEINKTHYLCFFLLKSKKKTKNNFSKKGNGKLQLISAKKHVKGPVFALQKPR